MSKDCGRYENEVWECARAGEELPPDARRHIEACADCAQAFAEARRLACLMQDAGWVPASPDCRSAVMERISGRRSRIPAWAYACAAILLAACALWGARLIAVPPASEQRMVRNDCATGTPRQPQTQQPARAESAKPDSSPQPIARESIAQDPAPRRAVGLRNHPTPMPSAPPRPHHSPENSPQPQPVLVKCPPEQEALPAEVEASDWPVAAVVVNWQPAPEGADQTYGYVKRNPETGVVTTCSVRRSGDSIEVRLESVPGGGETPPVKGSIDNETSVKV